MKNNISAPIQKIISEIRRDMGRFRKGSGEYDVLDSILDYIKEECPEDWQHYQEENYDGPGDNYYQQ